MLVAQRPHSTRLHDHRRLRQRPPNPPHCERSQNMPVPNNKYIARNARLLRLADILGVTIFANITDQTIQPVDNILRTLPTRTAIAPNIPVLIQSLFFPLLPDLSAGDALIVAVVPLRDARLHCYLRGCDVWGLVGGGGGVGGGLPWVGLVAA